MNKYEFLEELSLRLQGLPQEDIDERLNFYNEMIDDCMIEDGVTEEVAVARLGDLDTIAQQILSDVPLTKIVKEKMTPKQGIKGWQIAILILTSPIWVSILLAGLSLLLSAYITLLSVNIILWVIELSLACGVIAGIGSSVLVLVEGNLLFAGVIFGGSLVCAGATIVMFYVCKVVGRGVYQFSKKGFLTLKARLIRKEKTA